MRLFIFVLIFYHFLSIEEISWEPFAKEDNVWLDWSTALSALHDLTSGDALFELLGVLLLTALGAVSSSVGTMSLSDFVIHVKTSLLLKIVYILSQIPLENALVLQELNEVMSHSRLKFRCVKKLLSQVVKCPRLFLEKFQGENRLRIR